MSSPRDQDEGSDERTRLDKWLWAARFYKTRRLATEACDGGKVRIGDQELKPGRAVRVGERITIVIEQLAFVVDVLGLSSRRGPASEARLLYRETEEGRVERERAIAERKANHAGGPPVRGRPTKRDRRTIAKFVGRYKV